MGGSTASSQEAAPGSTAEAQQRRKQARALAKGGAYPVNCWSCVGKAAALLSRHTIDRSCCVVMHCLSPLHTSLSAAPFLCVCPQALLPPGPDPIAGLSSYAGANRSSEAGSMVLSSAGASLDGTSLAGAYSRGGTVPGTSSLNFTGSTFGGSTEPTGLSASQGPLSPRSLLASARAGMALVSSASPAGTPRARTPPSAAAAALAAPAPLRQGRFIVQEVCGSEDSDSEAESEGGSSDADQQEEEGSSAEPSIDGAAATAAGAGSLPTAAAPVGTSIQRPPLAR